MGGYLEKIGAPYIVYFDKREVKENQNEEIWIMISRAGQGEECYPVFYIKKAVSRSSKEFKSIRIENGHFCQI